MMDCFDKEPRDEYSCNDRANWNQCNGAWITRDNYCEKLPAGAAESPEQPTHSDLLKEEFALDRAFEQIDTNRDSFIDFDEWEQLYYMQDQALRTTKSKEWNEWKGSLSTPTRTVMGRFQRTLQSCWKDIKP